MRKVVIIRDFVSDSQSLGTCYVINECGDVLFQSESIERGWIDNKKMISCVPEGEYPLKLEWSPRFQKDLWELYDVPNRSECKFHSANYARQLNGCIALGEHRIDIDKDGYLDVTNSRATMSEFHEVMGDYKEAVVVIRNITSVV